MNDDAFNLTVILAGLIAFVILVLGGCWINHLNEKQFIAAGYSRTAMPGIRDVQWTK